MIRPLTTGETQLAREAFGYRPATGIRAGLEAMVDAERAARLSPSPEAGRRPGPSGEAPVAGSARQPAWAPR